VLDGKTPAIRAAELINASHLDDPKFRWELYKGGKVAVEAAADPMIVLLRQVDATTAPPAKTSKTTSSPSSARTARSSPRPASRSTNRRSPDATGTLRLSYGTVKGFTEDGKKIPTSPPSPEPSSTSRHGAQPPYVCPPATIAPKTSSTSARP